MSKSSIELKKILVKVMRQITIIPKGSGRKISDENVPVVKIRKWSL